MALLIGVGAFKHDLPDLGGSPQKDARALVAVLRAGGFSAPPAPGQPDAPFLAAHGSRPDRPDTMIGLNGLIAAGKSSGAAVLFLLDACRELTAGRGQARGFGPTRAVLPVGTAVLFGCGRGQVSHQCDKASGHGLFTYAVLEVLRGETGLTGDVSWSELVAAVQRAFRPRAARSRTTPGPPSGTARRPTARPARP